MGNPPSQKQEEEREKTGIGQFQRIKSAKSGPFQSYST